MRVSGSDRDAKRQASKLGQAICGRKVLNTWLFYDAWIVTDLIRSGRAIIFYI